MPNTRASWKGVAQAPISAAALKFAMEMKRMPAVEVAAAVERRITAAGYPLQFTTAHLGHILAGRVRTTREPVLKALARTLNTSVAYLSGAPGAAAPGIAALWSRFLQSTGIGKTAPPEGEGSDSVDPELAYLLPQRPDTAEVERAVVHIARSLVEVSGKRAVEEFGSVLIRTAEALAAIELWRDLASGFSGPAADAQERRRFAEVAEEFFALVLAAAGRAAPDGNADGIRSLIAILQTVQRVHNLAAGISDDAATQARFSRAFWEEQRASLVAVERPRPSVSEFETGFREAERIPVPETARQTAHRLFAERADEVPEPAPSGAERNSASRQGSSGA